MAALGVQLLQFVLLMKLRLQDATDTLDAFLWRDAVSVVTINCRGHEKNAAAVVVMVVMMVMMVSLIRSCSSASLRKQQQPIRRLRTSSPERCLPSAHQRAALVRLANTNTRSKIQPKHPAASHRGAVRCSGVILGENFLSESCFFVSPGDRPWLDACVMSYLDGDQNQMCHQICHTSITRHASAGR